MRSKSPLDQSFTGAAGMIKIQLSDQKIFLDTQQASGYNEEDSEDKKVKFCTSTLAHS